ncbi:MAG: hypothetical protein V1917_01240 [Candidatus Gottesmanbacteria bacterium]
MIRFFKKLPFFPVILGLLVVSISFFALYRWFDGGTISYYWDANLPMDTGISFRGFFYPWFGNKFPGFSGNGWSWLPYWAALSGLKALFTSLSNAQFILYVIMLSLTVSGFFVLLRHIRRGLFGETQSVFLSIIVPLVFSLCFAFNLYTYYYAYYMFNPQMFTVALLPWNILAIIKLFPLQKNLENGKLFVVWFIVYMATQIGMIPGFTTYVFLGQYLLFIGFYFILYTFLSAKPIIRPKTVSFMMLLIVTVGIHWIWFYPSLIGFTNLYESQKSFGVMEYLKPGSINTNLLNLFRLIGSAMMNNNKFSWDTVYTGQSILSFPLFVFPFFFIYLLVRLKHISQKTLILFLSFVTLVSLFIMKLANPPFAKLTEFLFQYVPLFGAFRDSVQKAGLYFLLSYFLLTAMGFELFIRDFFKKRVLIIVLSMMVVAGTVLITGPFFLFNHDNIKEITYYFNNTKYSLRSKTIIPREYLELKKYMEPICNGKTALVIPRTSALSSAVWDKYGYSYVGQDLLLNLVDCKLISTHLIQNDPDSFITSPYLMLQDNKFADFKKFLVQNHLSFILIRKDYVPYYFTQWINIDPIRIRQIIDSDSMFSLLYENDYFALYGIGDYASNESFGFTLTASGVYTNAPLKTAQDYKGLFSILPSSFSDVLFNKNDVMKKYSQYVNSYVARSNCVGCIKVLPSMTQANQDVVSKLKRVAKSILKKKFQSESVDLQISHDLIEANYLFSDLMENLNAHRQNKIKNISREYLDLTQKIFYLSASYTGNFFDHNNKLIEMRNFLIGQNMRLVQFQEDNVEQIAKMGYEDLYYVSVFQKNAIDSINREIWETDPLSNVSKMRFDIPKDGQYTCQFDMNKDFSIKKIIFNAKEIPSTYTDDIITSNLYLHQGSFPLEIYYEPKTQYSVAEIQSPNKTPIYSLGKLTNGSYVLRFDIRSKKPTIGLFIVVDRLLNNIDTTQLAEGNVGGTTILLSQIIKTSEEKKDINTGFQLDALENKQYYAYYFSLKALDTSGENVFIENIFFYRTIREQDAVVFCMLSGEENQTFKNPKVSQISPVSYELTVPERNNGMFLRFNQSFDADWKAYTITEGKRKYFNHIADGYANAWFIDDPNVKTIYIEFDRLKRIYINVLISSFICVVLGIVSMRLFYENSKRTKTN